MDASRWGLALATTAFALLALASLAPLAPFAHVPAMLTGPLAKALLTILVLSGLGWATTGKRDLLNAGTEPWWIVVGGLLVGAAALHPLGASLSRWLLLISGTALHVGFAKFAIAPLQGPARLVPLAGATVGILAVYLRIAFDANAGALEALAMAAYALGLALALRGARIDDAAKTSM